LIATDRITTTQILDDEDKEGWGCDNSAIYVYQRDDLEHEYSQQTLENYYKFMRPFAFFVRKKFIAYLQFNLSNFKVRILQ